MIRVCFALRLVIGSKKLKLLSQPIKSKTKTSCDSLAHVFPRFVLAALFASSFHWFTGLSVSFVIGQSENLGFGFTTLKN